LWRLEKSGDFAEAPAGRGDAANTLLTLPRELSFVEH
jgi:hypothetical protein